jgi:chromosome segregation ATPase
LIADSVDIKFACPQCEQRMVVDGSAAGHTANCPKCHSPVTVPHVSEPAEPVQEDPSPSAAPPATAGLSELDQARAEVARQHALFKKALEECERLKANATHIQAEFKSFQGDRQQLKADLAQARHVASTAEVHAAELMQSLAAVQQENVGLRSQAGREIGGLTERLASTERRLAAAEKELETGKEQNTEALRALARTRADYNRTHAEATGLRSEIEVLQQEFQAVTQGLAVAQGQLHEAQTRLEALTAEHEVASRERDEFREKAVTFEHDLQALDNGRELLDLRARFQASERKNQSLENDLAEKTETAVREKEVMRGILDRQNVTLAECHSALRRLRRGRFVLRSIYGLFSVGLVALGFLATYVFAPQQFLKVVGPFLKHFGH